MTSHVDIQQQLFNSIEKQLPEHVSRVDEVADLLDISVDSSYRRIRGEKRLTIDELQHLCDHFNLSLDALFNIEAQQILFDYNALNAETFTFTDYLQQILDDLQVIAQCDSPHILYAANDISLFHTLQVPEVAAFKFFFWQKTTLGFEHLKDQRFSIVALDDDLSTLRWKILDYYTKIPVTDILYVNAFSSTLKQIAFYCESGLFDSVQTALLLCEKMEALIDHMQAEAERSYNFIYGQDPSGQEGSYELYYNEVILTDDAVLVDTEITNTAYITNNALNILKTTDDRFFENTYAYLQNLMSKSMLISAVSEKERHKFFGHIRKKIQQLKQQCKQSDLSF